MPRDIDLPHAVFLVSALFTGLIVILIFGFIFHTAAPVLMKEGLGFLTGNEWNYDTSEYGILTFLCGTLIMTAVTMLLACPVGIATAIYLAEWAPGWLEKLIGTMIELLVGIPSVIFGIFGFFILEPIFRTRINPFIDQTLGFLPIFRMGNPDTGLGVLLASTVLAIMVLPTIVALSKEAMEQVPSSYREGSYSVGATQWETIRFMIIPVAMPGIVTAIILALMRAMGETMAVVMLLGATNRIPTSILDTGNAMTSKILTDIGYYLSFPEPTSALFAIGGVLFLIEIVMVALARFISRRITVTRGRS